MTPRFLVLDDHPIMTVALGQALRELEADGDVQTAASLHEVLEKNEPPSFKMVVIDLSLPDACGVESVEAVRHWQPNCPVVVCSGNEDRGVILECLRLGAVGFLPKSMTLDAMVHALRLIRAGATYVPSQAVHTACEPANEWRTDAASFSHGQPLAAEPSEPGSRLPGPAARAPAGKSIDPRTLGLTERQIQVLDLILQGLPNKLICRRLNLAEGTIKVHVSAVLRVLGVSNRTQAIIAANQIGLKQTAAPANPRRMH